MMNCDNNLDYNIKQAEIVKNHSRFCLSEVSV